MSSEYGLVVDWCYDFIEKELSSFNFELIKDIKIENYNSIKNIKDCFNILDEVYFFRFISAVHAAGVKNIA